MSKAKHTHAPMTMHHDHGWLVVSDASDGVYIKIAKGLGTEKEQSLARLIAAAPDLLEALQGMIEVVSNTEYGEIDRKLAVKDARAAIAKAVSS